jgi:hypothetical protein
MVPVWPAKLVGEFVPVEPLRLSESGGVGRGRVIPDVEAPAKLIVPPVRKKKLFGTV